METYILGPDNIGAGTLDRLEAAARRGVKYALGEYKIYIYIYIKWLRILFAHSFCRVSFLYDSVGSMNVESKMFEPLRQAGGRMRSFLFALLRATS